MAAPTFIGIGASAEGVGALTVALPPSSATGDLLLMAVETANQPVATPSGWNVAHAAQGTGTAAADAATSIQLFWKFQGAGEGSAAVADGGNHQIAIISAWRGVDTTTPINASNGDVLATANNDVIIPGVTTTVDDCMIVGVVAMSRDLNTTGTQFQSTWANASLTSVTEFMDEGTDQGTGGVLGGAYGVKATAGATGNMTGDLAGANSFTQARIMVALAPVAASGSFPIGVATETDTATARPGVARKAIGVATETDTALRLSQVVRRPIGVATETDTAVARPGVARDAIGTSTEADTAVSRPGVARASVRVASEADSATKRPGIARKALSAVPETDTAIKRPGVARTTWRVTLETDLAVKRPGIGRKAIGTATEVDTAIARPGAALGIRPGLETDTAIKRPGIARAPVRVSVEVDTAIKRPGRARKAIGVATETNTAIQLGKRMRSPVRPGTETDAAIARPGIMRRAIGVAFEIDAAFSLVGVDPNRRAPLQRRAVALAASHTAQTVPYATNRAVAVAKSKRAEA